MRRVVVKTAILVLTLAPSGCRKAGEPLGPADSFRVFVPRAGAQSVGTLRVLEEVTAGDARFAVLQKTLEGGFGGEILRTHYLAKQIVRDLVLADGRRFPDAARAAAGEPTVIVVGVPEADGVGFVLPRTFGGPVEHAGVPWIGLPDGFEKDPVLVQTIAGRLGGLIVGAVTGATSPAGGSDVLREGYSWAMEVISREWRIGDAPGPAGLLARDLGSREQRERFTSVRENALTGRGGRARPGAEMLADPGVAATVLYRMAQQRAIANRVGPAEAYAAVATDRLPPGVSPAAVFGTFRNLQTKLLGAWARAMLAGRPPLNIADLVRSYTAAFPAEKSDVIRLFVVTTYGATMRPEGVSIDPRDADRSAAELTALAAEAAAGRRPLVAP